MKIIRDGKVINKKCLEISTRIENTVDEDISLELNSTNANDLELVLIGPNRIHCTSELIINAFIVGTCPNATVSSPYIFYCKSN